MTVALITHPACLGHDAGAFHPECPDRLRAVLAALEGEDFADAAPRVRARGHRGATDPRPSRATTSDAILAIRPAPGETIQLDADTAMSAGSAEAALRAAGGAVMAVDAVMDGWARAAFAAVRPPGHHAEPPPADGVLPVQQRRDRRPSRARALGAARGSRWSISTSITATAPRRCFRPTPTCSTPPRTRAPAIRAPGAREERGCAGNIVNVPLRPGADGAGIPRRLDGRDTARRWTHSRRNC